VSDFVRVQAFTDGEILSRVPYSTLFDNDAYFHGIADAWNPVQNGVARGYLGTEESIVIYDGYHVLASDATALSYTIDLINTDAGHPSTITLYYDYGGAGQVTVATRSTTGTSNGAVGVGGLAPGFYRVYCVMTRAAGSTAYQAYGTCYPPYTRYTGALSFAAAGASGDGVVGTAADHFNAWRLNQLYFYDQLGSHAPFNSVRRGYNAAESELVIWYGWIMHKFRRIRYRAWLRENAGGNVLTLYYDYGGANEYAFATLDTETEVETYADLPDATFAPGSAYLVAAVISRTDTGQDTDARLRYIMESPVAATAGYTSLGTLVAGQYVFGDTAGEGTRAELLTANQANLEGRLVRRDYAVRKASYSDTAESTWMYWMCHRHPLLYYRGQNLVLKYGNANDYVTLPDTDDGDNRYRIYDLRQVDGLIRGVHYHIEGTPEYAAEFKEVVT